VRKAKDSIAESFFENNSELKGVRKSDNSVSDEDSKLGLDGKDLGPPIDNRR
jgi:hypothetical protein